MPNHVRHRGRANPRPQSREAFSHDDFHVMHAAGIAEARGIAAETHADVALLDLRLPDGSGLDMLDFLLSRIRTCR